MLSRSGALIRHEFRIMRSDPASFLSLTVMPVVMMAFFKPMAKLALAKDHPGANGSEFIVPGMTTMFAFFLVGYLGFAFFAEHRWNTWERLRASQARAPEILLAKTVPTLTICLVQEVLLFGSGFVLFHFRPRGSWFAVVAVAAALAFSLTGVGLLLAAVLKNEQQLNAFSNLGAIVLAGVSGALVPISVLPAWARMISPISPQYWAMRGFRAVILDGRGLAAVALPVGILLLVFAVTVVVAVTRFKFEEPKVVTIR